MLTDTSTTTSLKERILLVDDTPANLKLLTSILSAHNYDIRAVISGQMALTAIQAEMPDLVLLDVVMPDMDGYEVCERLRRDYQISIPIIFISAIDDTGGKVKAFRSGGVDFIGKPFEPEEVLARVASQLTLYRQRKEIEEQHQAIEKLRERDRQYYEELNRLKDQFVEMASHDLKNPVSLVTGYVDLILDQPEDRVGDPQVMDMLQRIKSAATRMQTLITDLLDLAKIETGLALTPAPIEMVTFLGSCLQNVELAAAQKDITLRFASPPDEITVMIDPERMMQVISNLLSNAINYTPEGGQVELRASVEQDCVTIQVADNGLGIAPEDVSHIFERFYRVKRKEYLGSTGTGLGLAIVKSLVEQHGGQIHVESKLGSGSVFTITLPFPD